MYVCNPNILVSCYVLCIPILLQKRKLLVAIGNLIGYSKLQDRWTCSNINKKDRCNNRLVINNNNSTSVVPISRPIHAY